MASKRGWFAIFDAHKLVLPDLLKAAARFAPADARPEDGFQIVTGDIASVALRGALGHADHWAQAVSKVARRTVISFFVLEGQWSYQVCHHGAVIRFTRALHAIGDRPSQGRGGARARGRTRGRPDQPGQVRTAPPRQ